MDQKNRDKALESALSNIEKQLAKDPYEVR
ncbi:MAG: hypothetical protein Ct9H90mP13_13800 [Pseudomonadota bacterium]|nr:MAG: hypothetical protein Ct9H90mP13_13800 [Pseudomonadota bacterium]